MKVLSIDAWACEENTWYWNNWSTVGEISKEDFEKLETDQDYASWFYDEGYTTTDSLIIVSIEDDQYNVVVCDAENNRPLVAIEYGPEY